MSDAPIFDATVAIMAGGNVKVTVANIRELHSALKAIYEKETGAAAPNEAAGNSELPRKGRRRYSKQDLADIKARKESGES